MIKSEQIMQHRYILTLEIMPLEVSRTYAELPSHLTLMSRFLSNLEPATLTDKLELLFRRSKPIHLTFDKISKLGPKGLTVYLAGQSVELSHLHITLRTLLDSVHVKYEYPQFIGRNYIPHVTAREGQTFSPRNVLLTKYCYLIEIINHQRVVQYIFKLSA